MEGPFNSGASSILDSVEFQHVINPVIYLARAKYDYDAKDADELSFKANNLMGILEADMTQQSWWVGAIYDEYRQTWSLAASIPSNFMNSTTT